MTTPGRLGPSLATTLQAFHDGRPPGADEDVHMVPAIVDHAIERLSSPGDFVFDPFAGFGTTLERAVRLGRRAAGIELLPERVEYMRRRIPEAWVTTADARDLGPVLCLFAGTVDLIVSSPPYMTMTHHDADPLTGYEESGGDYDRYLDELGSVAEQCAQLLAPTVFWSGTWQTFCMRASRPHSSTTSPLPSRHIWPSLLSCRSTGISCPTI